MSLEVFATILASFALTRTLITLLPRIGWMDSVGIRSSHASPTPRGGGMAFVLVGFGVAAWMSWRIEPSDSTMFWGVLMPSLAVAIVGAVDDARTLSPAFRLVTHLGASIFGAWWLLRVPAASPLLIPLAAIGVAWSINLFNFMDGADGFVATQSMAALALLAMLQGVSGTAANGAIAIVIAAAVAGFLPWNLPRARIFMGDAGSGWLGAVIGLLLLRSATQAPWIALGVTTWLAPLWCDATVCLLRRALRGDDVLRPHRIHAYQWLLRRVGSHGRMLLLWWAPLLTVYLPLALAVALGQHLIFAVVAAILGCLQAFLCGSGRSEVEA